MRNYKIAIEGTEYVGLSIATLLSQHHQVAAVDSVPEKVELINNRKSPIQDKYIVEFIDTVADAIGEQLIENRFIQLMSIYRSKKSKGELYKHAICKAQIIVSYVKGSTYFT